MNRFTSFVPDFLRRFPLAAAAIALGLALGGQPARATDLSGTWSGTWQSTDNNHRGPLHASFYRLNETQYQADFSGRFFRILPFRYSVVLNVVGQEGDKVLLAGESRLGRLFGTFYYQAEATATDFVAHYSSCRYRGVFMMSRCCVAAAAPVCAHP